MIPRLIQRPLLVADEELDLARKAHAGDEAARRKLVESNMRLVCNIAKHYHAPTIPFEDLVQEGAIGLMRAIDRFDPDKGCRFSTYATYWVRQAMGKALLYRSRVIRLPAHILDERKRVNRTREVFEECHGRSPNTEELIQATGFSREKLATLEGAEFDCLSLETGREGQWDYTSIIADSSCDDPELEACNRVNSDRLTELVALLPERERKVISMRLGLGGELTPVILRDLAQQLRCSREAIRQIEARGVRSLRRMLCESEDYELHESETGNRF
jgi:RNA polymerase primary sigma factor